MQRLHFWLGNISVRGNIYLRGFRFDGWNCSGIRVLQIEVGWYSYSENVNYLRYYQDFGQVPDMKSPLLNVSVDRDYHPKKMHHDFWWGLPQGPGPPLGNLVIVSCFSLLRYLISLSFFPFIYSAASAIGTGCITNYHYQYGLFQARRHMWKFQSYHA